MLALEVVPLPISDVDRALNFYTQQVGLSLDVDFRPPKASGLCRLRRPARPVLSTLSSATGQCPFKSYAL